MTSRARRVVGTVLLVLAGLLVPVAVVATWASRTVTNTDAFVERVSPVVGEPAVQTLVENQMTDTVSTVVIQELVGSRVNDAIDGLDAPDLVKVLLHNVASSAGGWAEERVANVSHKVVTAPEFEEAFRASLEGAHGELVGVLEGGEADLVSTDGRTVSIKVATLTTAVREELTAAGFDVADRIPEVQATIPITTVDQLDTWQGYYRMLRALVWLGPLLVVGLAVAGAWLRRDLTAAGLWFAGAGIVGVLGVTWTARALVDDAASGILDQEKAAAARAVVRSLTSSLQTNAQVVLVVLVMLAIAAAVVRWRPQLVGLGDRVARRRPVGADSEV